MLALYRMFDEIAPPKMKVNKGSVIACKSENGNGKNMGFK
jgi:hypothetical protein